MYLLDIETIFLFNVLLLNFGIALNGLSSSSLAIYTKVIYFPISNNLSFNLFKKIYTMTPREKGKLLFLDL
jgi:hypothetical protein